MEKSKAVLLLRSFSKEEIKRFSDFLQSPYFNTNTRVFRLFEELKKHHPEYTGKAIEKETLYKKLFTGKDYNEQVMKNLITELLHLEKEFLSIDHYNKDKHNKSLGLLHQLASREVDSLYNKEIESFEENARENITQSVLLHYLLFQMEEINIRHNISRNRQSEITENLTKSAEYLTIFFLKNILRLSVNININRFSFNAQIPVNLADKFLSCLDIKNVLEYMESSAIEQSLNLKLLFYAMTCNVNINDDESYNIYKDLLHSNLGTLNRDEAHTLLHFLESVCAQKINSGKSEFYKDLFETYELEIANNIYTPDENSPLTVMKFRNIYLTALKAGKYDWAEDFINNYKSRLHDDNRKNIVELALAKLNFEKGEYELTLQHLQKIKTEQVFFKVDSKVLNLMAFYELGHYESAISLLESFKRMLTSNVSLTKQYSQKNIAFANLVGSLIKIRTSFDKKAVEDLKAKITNTETIGNKGWLMKKIEELK